MFTKDNLFHIWIILVDSQLCLIGRGTTANVDHLFLDRNILVGYGLSCRIG